MFVLLSNFLGVSEELTGKIENDPNLYKSLQAIILALLILFPVGLTRKMSGLRYISIISVSSMIFITLVTLCSPSSNPSLCSC